MAEEIWKKLIYPGIDDDVNRFEVSTFGRLRNIATGHIYKQNELNTGYYSVKTTLGSRKRKIHIIIHKAVAYTFLSNDDGLPEVNHKDGVKTNNYVENLEWCTSHYNQKHKYDIGLLDKRKISGENNNCAKLTWDDVEYIRKTCVPKSRKLGIRAMSRRFGVSHITIQKVLNYETWIIR